MIVNNVYVLSRFTIVYINLQIVCTSGGIRCLTRAQSFRGKCRTVSVHLRTPCMCSWFPTWTHASVQTSKRHLCTRHNHVRLYLKHVVYKNVRKTYVSCLSCPSDILSSLSFHCWNQWSWLAICVISCPIAVIHLFGGPFTRWCVRVRCVSFPLNDRVYVAPMPHIWRICSYYCTDDPECVHNLQLFTSS